MFKIGFFIVFTCFVFGQSPVTAQRSVNNRKPDYEITKDDPYDINKLYIHIQPVYGEFFMTNINIGFGIEADYYLKNVLNMNFSFRKAYGQKFDFLRDVAEKNSDVLNSPRKFYIGEIGATIHIIDREKETPSRFILYSKNFRQQNRWETMNVRYVQAQAKLRKIIGVRAGGISFQSVIDVNRIRSAQGITLSDSSGTLGAGISIYSSIINSGFYLGGSIQLIRNASLSFDKSYQPVSNDLIFTAFADILLMPFSKIDDVFYQPSPQADEIVLNTGEIKLNMVGVRAGIKGMFNRDLSFGYSAEIGYRPGIRGENFYILGKISFPLFSSSLIKEVESEDP